MLGAVDIDVEIDGARDKAQEDLVHVRRKRNEIKKFTEAGSSMIRSDNAKINDLPFFIVMDMTRSVTHLVHEATASVQPRHAHERD